MDKSNLKIDYQFEKIYTKAMSYCLSIIIKKRYTISGMKEKIANYLEKNKISSIYSKSLELKLISRLKELNYLNDLEYSKDYFEEKLKIRQKGKFKIINELKQKGVSSDIITEALGMVDIEEDLLINNLFEKMKNKWNKLPLNKQKEKAFRFFLSRGFSSESIYNLINNHYSNIKDKDY
jgi:regulatory protein